jgi:hypothetical protein
LRKAREGAEFGDAVYVLTFGVSFENDNTGVIIFGLFLKNNLNLITGALYLGHTIFLGTKGDVLSEGI